MTTKIIILVVGFALSVFTFAIAKNKKPAIGVSLFIMLLTLSLLEGV